MTKERIKETRAHYPNHLLMVREGETYRFYGGDALKVARDTGLDLHNLVGTPTFVSIPANEAERYVNQLLKAGHRVVIAEETGEEILKQEALPTIEAPAIGTGQVCWPVEQQQPRPEDRAQEDLFR